jgi:hypothetical protein
MARSNNNNKLKAYVRFDGSGRVVSSSLIVQAFKPKVGKWKEIDAKECCNYSTTTTTTTTLEFLTLYWIETAGHSFPGDACAGIEFAEVTAVYASSNTLGITTFYLDAEGTIPFVGDGMIFYAFYKNLEEATTYYCDLDAISGEVFNITPC